MLLRDHPLMAYKGVRTWPPVWLRPRGSYENTHPTGEVGTLKDVLPFTLPHPKICFLTTEHGGAEYTGALLLSVPVFCREIWTLLRQNCGKTIQEIGDIDLSYTSI